MGRHTVPGSGRPEPDRGFWLRILAVVAVAALVVGYVLTRDGDDAARTQTAGPATTTAATTSTPATTSSPTTAAPTSTSPSPSTTPTTKPTRKKRAPTLRFVVRRSSWITVRVPGGRTLVSRQFPAGARRSFDQRVLQVVNGRPSAVDFYVNGTLRKPGPADQTDTFRVRRR